MRKLFCASWVVAFLSVATPPANAAEMRELTVDWQDEIYSILAIADLDAPIDAVRRVLVDVEHYHWITGAIRESTLLDRQDATEVTIYTRMEACFGPFCKEVEQVQRVNFSERNVIRLTSLPQYSDVKFGESFWQLEALDDGRTRITWSLQMEPDFWVPPLIGPALVRSGLREEGRDTIRGIEILANKPPYSR
ncbi:MAG: SRPBCC family protein [Gammaproteobacteria bacterium]|nr:SRPBCC family protein [Gammaproteobacteria bacterium]